MRPLLILLVILSLGAARVEIGFDGYYRPGRFVPVFVTADAETVTPATVEVYVPGAGSPYGERVATPVTLAPEPATFAVQVAPGGEAADLTVTISAGDRVLAHVPDRVDGEGPPTATAVRGDRLLAVVSGRTNVLAGLDGGDVTGAVAAGFVDERRLPAAAIGYDAADVVVLDRPAWNTWPRERLRALVAHVEAGGRLIVIPGAEVVPDELRAILPPVGDLQPDGVRAVDAADGVAVVGGVAAVGFDVTDAGAGFWQELFERLNVQAKGPRATTTLAPAGPGVPVVLLGVLALLGPAELIVLTLLGRRRGHPVAWVATALLIIVAVAMLASPDGAASSGTIGWERFDRADGDVNVTQGPDGISVVRR